MTTDDSEAAARYILEELMKRHPAQAAPIASLILLKLLETVLHGDDDTAAESFVTAINARLAAMALAHRAGRAWQLVSCDPPTRQ